jgi:hypothetical protein
MEINLEKSYIILNNCSINESNLLGSILPAPRENTKEGFKYSGFFLKPNRYIIDDWEWLIKNGGSKSFDLGQQTSFKRWKASYIKKCSGKYTCLLEFYCINSQRHTLKDS